MTGMGYMIVGFAVAAMSTIGFIIVEVLLARKKRRIREKSYQIYQ